MEMLVECKLKRPGGTDVDLGGNTIQFRPENDRSGRGRHIAVVTNKTDLVRLLQIPEAYDLAMDDDPPAPAPVLTTTAPPVTLQAPAPTSPPPGAAAVAAIGGVVMDPGPVSLVDPTTGLAPPPAPDPGAAGPQMEPGNIAPPDEDALEAMSIEDLRAQYELETGKKPSPVAKETLLISRILGYRAEKNPA